MVAAGTVVKDDVPDYALVAGVPAEQKFLDISVELPYPLVDVRRQ